MSVKDIVAGDNGNQPDDKPPDPYANLPMKFEPRCKVCRSQFREIIDRLLVSGNSYISIAEQFRGKDVNLSGSLDAVRKSVERHRHRHLSVRDAAVREILEHHAREAGILVETARDQLLSEEALLQLAVSRGTEQLANPDSKIKYQDAIRAAELLRDKKYEEMTKQQEIAQRQVWAISQAVKDIVPADLFPAIAERASRLFEGEVFAVDGTATVKQATVVAERPAIGVG